MTDLSTEARALLGKAASRTVVMIGADPRWPVVTELQVRNLVRLKWGAGQIAQLEVTAKGRDALPHHQRLTTPATKRNV